MVRALCPQNKNPISTVSGDIGCVMHFIEQAPFCIRQSAAENPGLPGRMHARLLLLCVLIFIGAGPDIKESPGMNVLIPGDFSREGDPAVRSILCVVGVHGSGHEANHGGSGNTAAVVFFTVRFRRRVLMVWRSLPFLSLRRRSVMSPGTRSCLNSNGS